MDGLSIAASIIAVLQAANAVISICYDYSAALKDAPWQLSKITAETKTLRNVLETLENLAAKAKGGDPAAASRLPSLTQLCEPIVGALPMCLVELDALNKKLAPPGWAGPSGSKKAALTQALRWPLKERIRRSRSSVSGIAIAHCASLHVALEHVSLDQEYLIIGMRLPKMSNKLAGTVFIQRTLTLAIQDTVRGIQDSTTSVRDNITTLNQKIASTKRDRQHERIRKWLSAPDPSLNHNAGREKCQRTTGSSRARSSVTGRQTQKIFSGFMGLLGVVKRFFAQPPLKKFCVIALSAPHNKLAAVREGEQQEHDTIPSLALELLYSSCDESRQPSVEELLTTLRTMTREFAESFIILDALDECTQRKELLKSVKEIIRWYLDNLHILVTSQKERDIQTSLESIVKEQDRIWIQKSATRAEKAKVQEEIETTLMGKADGRFRWVVCQLDALESCVKLSALRSALAFVPNTLDETYARILCSNSKQDSQDALKILQWLIHSSRPMRIEKIVKILAVETEVEPSFDPDNRLPEPEDILAICPSLIAIITTGESEYWKRQEVRLAHFSIKEYLISQSIQAGSAAR
ncbi:MAG: hypothetical protein MMC33_007575 [Icmadophila ericetorum]|nr:hypothetical protein [Icmadophila ericetorum]